ncbi:MAG: hypothetical protein GEV08_19655 [Acidimicrobiia bacterium]|nr:hypothetical protein [Acidimicrobiia bacterium]
MSGDPAEERRRLVVTRDDGVPALFPPEALERLSFTAMGLLLRITAQAEPPSLDELLAEAEGLDGEDEARRALAELVSEGFLDSDLQVRRTK